MSDITPAPDANVRALQQLLGERSAHGLAKYGTTTERTDLTLRDWLQHQLEELLDGAVYARAAIARIDQLVEFDESVFQREMAADAYIEVLENAADGYYRVDESEQAKAYRAAKNNARHPDDLAVDKFAAALKAKLADARAKGRRGWDDKYDCDAEILSSMLRDHVEKGDPRDVAAFCCFLWNRGERITP